MKQILKNDVAILSVGQLLQQVITMGTGIMLARALGSSGYGIVNILRTLFVGIVTVAPLGLDIALLKYCGRYGVDAPHVLVTLSRLRLFSALLNSSVALVLGIGFGGVLMQNVYHYEHFDIMLTVTMIGLPFAADIGIMGAYYKAKNRPGLFALMTIYLQPILRFILVAIAVLVWPNVFAVVCINTIQIVASSVAVISHNRLSRREPHAASFPSDPVLWSEAWGVLSESVWMAVNLLVYSMMRFVDILVLGYYVPAAEIGEYAAMSTVSQLVQVYPLAASQTLGPTISHHYHAGNVPGIRRALGDYIHLASLVSGFMFAGIAVFGTRLDLVFGHSFHFQQDISILMPLGYLLSAMLAPTGFALSMTGRHKAELGILCLGGIALLILCWILVPKFGQVGAATAVAASFFIINTIRFGYVSKVLGFIPGHWRDFLPPLVGLVLAYVARSLIDTGFERTFPATFAACLLYAALYALVCQMVLFRPSLRTKIKHRLHAQFARLRSKGA